MVGLEFYLGVAVGIVLTFATLTAAGMMLVFAQIREDRRRRSAHDDVAQRMVAEVLTQAERAARAAAGRK